MSIFLKKAQSAESRLDIKVSIKLSALLACGLMLPACSPDFRGLNGESAKGKNAFVVPQRFDATSPPVPEIVSGLRSLFSDSQLNFYVNKALNENPDLKLSLARLEEAGFNTKKAYAATVPQLTGNVSTGRSRTAGFGGSGFSGPSNTRARYAATLDAQWELDVWGRIKAGTNAARQTEQAFAADLAAMRQSVAAQTMQAYFSLIATEKLLELSVRRLKSFDDSLALVDRRFESGTGNLGDVDLARTDVENTRAQVDQRKNDRDQAARQLAALTGSYPDSKSSASSWPSLRRGVAAGIPSDVLMQRPDIDAAYQRIRAADSNVKVAHTDIYPRFSLTGSAGQQSNVLKDLADSNFSVWSLAGNMVAPLLDGGNRKAELGAANARAKQAYASYQSTVLGAFQEVENALGSERYLISQQASFQKALEAANRAETRILRSYESGLVEILTLLDAQRRSFNTEESLINTTALRYQNRVSLALALGKGL